MESSKLVPNSSRLLVSSDTKLSMDSLMLLTVFWISRQALSIFSFASVMFRFWLETKC